MAGNGKGIAMIGKSSLMLLGMAAVAGAVLFETSFKVQELEESLSSVNRQIVAEHDAIQVLRAEWALLNEPSRLDRLSKAYLPLQPAEPKQYAAASAVPNRKPAEPAVTAGPVVASVGGPLLPRLKPVQTAARAEPAGSEGSVLLARLGATR
jgi:hypothetical protein